MKSITIKNYTIRTVKLSFMMASLIGSSLLLTSCSQVSSLLKISSDSSSDKDSALVVPPTLRLPGAQVGSAKVTAPAITTRKTYPKSRGEVIDSKDYYVVVGTYPSQNQALDTFVRLSSIGLPHATMESRKTKTGKMLHMVRLGPFHKQSVIDRVKDKLVSDGMSQFKVVVN
ncbi:MAG: SPOR domain-containing protein [Cocleimonas sp.]|nr:SPOR domain-containing protein [Cocleimonas sp.]